MNSLKKKLGMRKKPNDDNEDSIGSMAKRSTSRGLLLQNGIGFAKTESIQSETVKDSGRKVEPRASNVSTSTSIAKGDENPLGLSVVYNPRDVQRKVDIIFVHGLGGTSRASWSQNKDVNLFWPGKFLPQEQGINQARILTFGYNAGILKNIARSSASILDFAKDLLFDMRYASDEKIGGLEIGNVPIIFVVHSMGGLVVKDAYLQGQNDPNYQDIVKAVSAIIFLSTPHRGTNLAETLNRILQATMISPSKEYIRDLFKNSITLQRLNEEFRHLVPKLNIVSLYETQTTTIGLNKIMVLEKDSSTLGYPGEISKALHTDHHGVCKYASMDDQNYVSVRNVLKSLIRQAIQKQDYAGIFESHTTSQQIKTILGISEAPDSDYIFFRDRWTPGTCKWLLNNETYRLWVDASCTSSQILWLQGDPGTGKSILSSFLINELAQKGLNCQYFFIRFGDHNKQSANVLLRSLAFQIAQEWPEFCQKILGSSEDLTQLKEASPEVVWHRLFKSILFAIKSVRHLYWVIDGLDESDESLLILKFLSDISTSLVPIHLFIASRKTHLLEISFQKLLIEVQNITTEGESEDLECFIDKKMVLPGSEEVQKKVKNEILNRARGNFLWVHLAAESLINCYTWDDVHTALNKLPAEMSSWYDRMAQTIADNPNANNKKLASMILAWAACSLRPLTVTELSEALDQDTVRLLDFQQLVTNLCGGFVVRDTNGNVLLIHETARDYLVGGQTRPFSIKIQVANRHLFRRCMSCLTTSGLRTQVTSQRGPELLDYAATSWYHHLQTKPESLEEDLPALLGFLEGTWILIWIQYLAMTKQTTLMTSAANRLSRFAADLIQLETGRMASGILLEKAHIIQAWATDLVRVEKKFGIVLLLYPDSIYSHIPPFCPKDSVIYKLFGGNQSKRLSVSGLASNTWDDCLARLTFDSPFFATSICAAGNRIVVSHHLEYFLIFNAITFENLGEFRHSPDTGGEPVKVTAQLNAKGTLLITCGPETSKIWDLIEIKSTIEVQNPAPRFRASTIIFTEYDDEIIIGDLDGNLWKLVMGQSDSVWTKMAQFDERGLDSTLPDIGKPIAINADASQIAVKCGREWLLVFNVENLSSLGPCVGRIRFQDRARCIWVVKWHPYSGEVFGLLSGDTLFKWRPSDDNKHEIRVTAIMLAISPSGSVLATGGRALIQIFTTTNLSLIYQLSCHEGIYDLKFSPDSTRLYDIRGSFGNAWEPSCLLNFSKGIELPDASATGKAMISRMSRENSIVLANDIGQRDHIISFAAQPHGTLYCFGTRSGRVAIRGTSCTRIIDLEEKLEMFDSKFAWNHDGTYLAFVGIMDVLHIYMVTISSPQENDFDCHLAFQTRIDTEGERILKVFFQLLSNHLLVVTGSFLILVSFSDGAFTNQMQFRTHRRGISIWLNGPSNPYFLLQLDFQFINICDWQKPGEYLKSFFYGKEMEGLISCFAATESTPTDETDKRWTAFSRIFAADDRSKALLVFDPLLQQGHEEVYESLKCARQLSPQEYYAKLCSTGLKTIPHQVTQRIQKPLRFLSDRLFFLDTDFWLCSWRYHSIHIDQEGKVIDDGLNRGEESEYIKRHYFLPRDWVSSVAIRNCALLDDGTFIIPKDHEVAVVKCSTLGL